MSVPWFDEPTAGLVGGVIGSLVGLWGAAVGTLSSLLIPRCRGRGWLMGLLRGGLVAGGLLVAVGFAALMAGQPGYVGFVFGLSGVMLGGLAAAFLPVLGRRYRLAEEQRMDRQDAV